MNISAEDFDEVVELLEEALDEAGVETGDISNILTLIGGLKAQIVAV